MVLYKQLSYTLIMLLVVFTSVVITGCDEELSKAIVFGDSMYPTFEDGEEIYYTEDFDKIDHGDIITFTIPGDDDAMYIKRVIGLTGDKVDIKENIVFINDVELDGIPYDFGDVEYFIHNQSTIVGEGEVFVLGDNYNNSRDSRSYGCVPISNVKGIIKE